jgi:hypothetical protein
MIGSAPAEGTKSSFWPVMELKTLIPLLIVWSGRLQRTKCLLSWGDFKLHVNPTSILLVQRTVSEHDRIRFITNTCEQDVLRCLDTRRRRKNPPKNRFRWDQTQTLSVATCNDSYQFLQTSFEIIQIILKLTLDGKCHQVLRSVFDVDVKRLRG